MFKRHQTEATSISVDMNRVKTSVPSGDMDRGDSQRDGHSHYAQVLISVQLKTVTQCMGSGAEILKGNLTLEFLISDFFFFLNSYFKLTFWRQ